MSASTGPSAIPVAAPDDPRVIAARPHTLDEFDLARLELASIGAWPIRFRLTLREPVAEGATLALRNAEGVIFALLEATTIARSPEGDLAASGSLTQVRRRLHPDFPELRPEPAELRASLPENARIDAVFVENTIDAAFAARMAAALRDDAVLLVIRRVAEARPGDVAHHVRVRALELVVRLIDRSRTRARLLLVPAVVESSIPTLALRRAIAAAYGATRLLMPRDELPTAGEAGIEYAELPDSAPSLDGWNEVEKLLSRADPPRSRRGFTVWFTGLSQAGKSTIATRLSRLLLDYGRGSTLLDGDVVRTHLSKGLGFSREDRDTNIRRLGYVAGEITRHGGVALVAAISPYRSIRAENRARIGDYVEVFVNAPVATCESRDQKGQYARARRGEIKGFTGIDDPYEPPMPGDGEWLECRTDRDSPEESAHRVFDHLVTLGYVDPADRIA